VCVGVSGLFAARWKATRRYNTSRTKSMDQLRVRACEANAKDAVVMWPHAGTMLWRSVQCSMQCRRSAFGIRPSLPLLGTWSINREPSKKNRADDIRLRELAKNCTVCSVYSKNLFSPQGGNTIAYASHHSSLPTNGSACSCSLARSRSSDQLSITLAHSMTRVDTITRQSHPMA
jgi:hypothetical protein